MAENSKSNSGSISVLGLLGVAFVVLKLTNVINWSWWWVLLPFYGGLVLILIIGFILGFIGTIVVLLKDDKKITNKFRNFKK